MTTGKGTVYWITGLAGAGKTTIAKALVTRLSRDVPNLVYLDGDTLREVFGRTNAHSLEDRRELAFCYARLCKMLAEQGIHVICATISLFKEIHDFLRAQIGNCKIVYIKCDVNELIRRDQKGIYSQAQAGKLKNVLGIDLPYDEPKECDLVIDNTQSVNTAEIVEKILAVASSKS
jgi:cytidine diphosphoramidate kinase